METVFFLASNSGKGFYSLYEGFPDKGNFLHIIKGGPGTGKSGFMRKIAHEARRRGMDTEIILCSADPDSLDGLYIPALSQAWVDGTAPHVTEPQVFGADSDYVNLGGFCKVLDPKQAELAESLNRRYKQFYASAYSFLAAEAAAASAFEPEPLGEEQLEQLREIIEDIIAGEQRGRKKGAGKEKRRFISAISSRGKLCLKDSVEKLCKQNYWFDEPLHAHQLLLICADIAKERGIQTILCPEPLRPDRLEALLLPELELCFACADADCGRAGVSISFGRPPIDRSNRQQEKSIREELRRQATGQLGKAKALHDELEALYKPNMDFAALDEYTDKYIENLFAGIM